ncbi:hypothetical protein L2712_12130 [Shewanella marisflavi]|uniref:hypothetical protein n=1 Tax=Shewanella marisflavi TaxID=260364 RepID=UPI00200C25D4|nr:hypothetical protein [Shewanella marisflavi]MCL1042386.1 hypothetical protein [Shewanella marisflavi]
MDNDFFITVEGFENERLANELGNSCMDMVRALDSRYSSLNISKLKRIVITVNFANSLSSVCSSYGHQSESAFTNSEQAIAVGQLVSKLGSDGEYEEFTLVLGWDFFGELFVQNGNGEIEVELNGDETRTILQRLLHELFHVHEKNTLNLVPASMMVDGYANAILMIAVRGWSEYFANYMSSFFALDCAIESTFLTLRNVLTEVPQEITELVNQYKSRLISIEDMFASVRERLGLIVNSYAYAKGFIDSLALEVETFDVELYEVMSASPLYEVLVELGEQFYEFLDAYNSSSLTSVHDYDGIGFALKDLYRVFSLDVTRMGDGVYVSVH